MWFDYPDAATSSNHLYITFNAFSTGGSWLRAFAFKLPLNTLRDGTSLGYQWWSTTTHGSLRLTQGAQSSMFFGSHNGGRQLRIFGWPDTSNSIGTIDVTVRTLECRAVLRARPRRGGLADQDGLQDYRCLGERNSRWLSLDRRRPHGASNAVLKGALVDTATRALVEEPEIWNSSSAFAYPAACPNASGVPGVSLFFGGGPRHPSHVVGFRDGAEWRLVVTRAGTNGPPNGAWGDYLSCRRFAPGSSEWVASGYTLQGGTNRQNIEPQYVQFGIG